MKLVRRADEGSLAEVQLHRERALLPRNFGEPASRVLLLRDFGGLPGRALLPRNFGGLARCVLLLRDLCGVLSRALLLGGFAERLSRALLPRNFGEFPKCDEVKFNGACFTEEESDMILCWSEASLKTSSQVFVFELAVRAILIRHLYDLFYYSDGYELYS